MAGILSPLIIGELVKDHEKRWRWIRIDSAVTALAIEGMHTLTGSRGNVRRGSGSIRSSNYSALQAAT
jgi:hypothetical protein